MKPNILIICDVGPDPDDAKVVVAAAVLHAAGKINLVGVVCNGGHDQHRRAALGRTLLDLLHLTAIPVGVGESGQQAKPNDYEFHIQGFEGTVQAVHDLPTGQEVLFDAYSNHDDVVIQQQSGLMDISRFIKENHKLFLEKTVFVSIMGGVVPEDTVEPDLEGGRSPLRRWRADTANNNTFDLDAADHVYAFLQSYRIPTIVVGRDAIPMLPMSVAKDVASQYPESEILRYLLHVQEQSIVRLWSKVLNKQLPPRCDPKWFFTTFCGVPADGFTDKQAQPFVDKPDTIRGALNGTIKPYDLVTLFTALRHIETDDGHRADRFKVMMNTGDTGLTPGDVEGMTREMLSKAALIEAQG